MRVAHFVVALVAALLSHSAAKPLDTRQDDLMARIEKQNKISLQGVLDNIGPRGKKAPGASPGTIIASPSSRDPEYFFTWTRDAALTMKMIVDEFSNGKRKLQPLIEDYIKAQAIVQTVPSLSGALDSGRGLGEPKYNVNLTRFLGSWGRPQRDGPALRATTLMTYARALLDTGEEAETTQVRERIWPVIQNDLNYVAQYWNETGFDLWEEVRGSSLFTSAVQYRALVEGAVMGGRLKIPIESYTSQALNIQCFLNSFWNGKYAVANINTEQGFSRSGIDANAILTSIAMFESDAECEGLFLQPCSSHALATLKVYVDSFRSIYPINKDASGTCGIATGRYSEDQYYGGHPWYITTLSVAEQLYDAIQQWSTRQAITITEIDLAFWRMIYPTAKTGTVKQGEEMNKLIKAVIDYADSFVEVALKYTPSSGSLSEQFSRENGTQVSARDLTWSYASFITMRNARLAATNGRSVPAIWSERLRTEVPPVCQPGSAVGNYKPAVAAGAPPVATGCTIIATFNVNATTFFGEDVYLTGSEPVLGNWSSWDAIPGGANGYTKDRPLWTHEAELQAGSTVHYRYLRKEPDGKILQEKITRTLKVPACANKKIPGTAVVEDVWVGPVGVPP